MKTPKILGPDHHDFHDSRLLSFCFSNDLTTIDVVIKNVYFSSHITEWRVIFYNVLRFEMETLSTGQGEYDYPEIYDIYSLNNSDEYHRWKQRLSILDVPEQVRNVSHVVLASSLYSGYGERKKLEGIQIICRGFNIVPAD